MRFLRILAGFVVLVAAASAAEIKIKVVDPHSAAVAGAQVELFHGDTSTPAAIQTTSADGLASISRNRVWALSRADIGRRVRRANDGYFGFRFRHQSP